MSDDLVERLRAKKRCNGFEINEAERALEATYESDPLTDEAADEITRLRSLGGEGEAIALLREVFDLPKVLPRLPDDLYDRIDAILAAAPKAALSSKQVMDREAVRKVAIDAINEHVRIHWAAAFDRVEIEGCHLAANAIAEALSLASPAVAENGGAVSIPGDLYRFLMGEGEIDGASFGDLNDGLPGRFWWRALLRTAALSTPTAPAVEDGWTRAEAVSVDDEIDRAFISGWNARLDHGDDIDMALHHFLKANITPVCEIAAAPPAKGAGE